MSEMLLIAHRGESQEAPENTIEGCKLAIAQGASGLEVDIRLTRDEEIVLFHDKTLHRHFGSWKLASLTTLREFQSLRFNRKTYHHPGKIASLQEFLEEFRHKVPLNLDVKTLFANPFILAHKLVRLIKDFHMEDQVWISAFNPLFLKLLHQLTPRLRTGYLFSNLSWLHQHLDLAIGADAWHPHYRLISPLLMERAQCLHKDLYVWTVNDPQLAQELSRYPFKGIITDRLFRVE